MANLTSSGRRSNSLHRKVSSMSNTGHEVLSGSQTPVPRQADHTSTSAQPQKSISQPLSPAIPRRVSYATSSVPHAAHQSENMDYPAKQGNLQHLPITADEFTHAVAVATASALRQQQRQSQSPARIRAMGGSLVGEGGGGHGGHDAPSWSRTVSASVLLACTALYALIAGALIAISPLRISFVDRTPDSCRGRTS